MRMKFSWNEKYDKEHDDTKNEKLSFDLVMRWSLYFDAFFYISATNFIVMTHKVFRHCKLQITIHIHIENDIPFFVWFSISLCSLAGLKRYFYNRCSISFAAGFSLTTNSSS